MRLEGLGQLKRPTISRTEPATLRLAAWRLIQLSYHLPPSNIEQVLTSINPQAPEGAVFFSCINLTDPVTPVSFIYDVTK
jgi:hypothetical protein